MFDYIVCFYFGKRRVKTTNSLLLIDKCFFTKKYCSKFLKYNNNIVVYGNQTGEELIKPILE